MCNECGASSSPTAPHSVLSQTSLVREVQLYVVQLYVRSIYATAHRACMLTLPAAARSSAVLWDSCTCYPWLQLVELYAVVVRLQLQLIY